jgi:pyrophosphatase PpaX
MGTVYAGFDLWLGQLGLGLPWTLKHKPDGEPALKACEILGVSPREALFVGDSHFDIMCGHNAGMNSCFVEYSAVPMEEINSCNPEYVIGNLSEIIDIVESELSMEINNKEVG